MDERLRVEIRVLTNLAQLQPLQREWEALWHSDPAATVFQSYEWVHTWAEHYDHCIARLLVLACYAEGQLVGLAPLYVRRGAAWPPVLRTVMFTGTGEPEAEEACAEYMAPLFARGWAADCTSAMGRVIAAQADVACLAFQRVRREAVAELTEAVSRMWSVPGEQRLAGTCYAMPASLEKALAQMSGRQRAVMRRKLRKFDEIEGGPLEFARDEAERQEFMQQLIELHQERWRQRGRAGVFSSEVFRRFHEALSSKLQKRGELVLARLRVADRPLALVYGFRSKKTCYYYQGGVATNTYQAISPGLLLHLKAADALAVEGIEHYDLMLSAAPDYKARIRQRDCQLYSFSLRRSLAHRARALAHTMKPAFAAQGAG
jgi:CelD/BcsL family acetyltransferase involved in cellulose biosynthesis